VEPEHGLADALAVRVEPLPDEPAGREYEGVGAVGRLSALPVDRNRLDRAVRLGLDADDRIPGLEPDARVVERVVQSVLQPEPRGLGGPIGISNTSAPSRSASSARTASPS